MILGDAEIRSIPNLVKSPDELLLINPASVNVRIGRTFLIPKTEPAGVHLGDEVAYDYRLLEPGEEFCLHAGQFALATTMEELNLPAGENAIAAYVQGRSSIGRAGLAVQNAGYVDPGFYGHITLELKNETQNDMWIAPGYPVAQIIFESATPVEKGYCGKYNGQVEATGSRMHLD